VGKNNDLVDRFLMPITGNTSNTRIYGIFNLSVITLSLSAHCSEYYTGEECDQRVLQLLTAETTSLDDTTSVATSSLTTTVVFISVVVTVILLLLFLSISMLCCLVCQCLRKKERVKVDIQLREMVATDMANIHADLVRLSERRHSVSYLHEATH